MRVFVNEQPVEVPAGASVRDAVEATAPDLGRALDVGRAYATDGTGCRMDAAAPAQEGGIVRVIVAARREASGGDRD